MTCPNHPASPPPPPLTDVEVCPLLTTTYFSPYLRTVGCLSSAWHIEGIVQHCCKPNKILGQFCIQVWNPDSPEDEVLVMVCRTGLRTTIGEMIRELIAPSRVIKQKNAFVPVSAAMASSD